MFTLIFRQTSVPQPKAKAIWKPDSTAQHSACPYAGAPQKWQAQLEAVKTEAVLRNTLQATWSWRSAARMQDVPQTNGNAWHHGNTPHRTHLQNLAHPSSFLQVSTR